MWIGAIRLAVATKDSPDAGTDALVTVEVLRDGAKVVTLALDFDGIDDLERGSHRTYAYVNLPRHNDQTPELPPGIGQSPMPYPDHGIEFSHGLPGHLRLRLRIHDDDMWVKDSVTAWIKRIEREATSFDTEAWVEHQWSHLGDWTQDVALSEDDDEGVTTWTLRV